jgi:hypothetical protein
MLGSLIRRPIPALGRRAPGTGESSSEWYDPIAIDSAYDYEPVWAKLRELRIAPSFHNGARSILLRNSPSNFCYNHIGHFASPARPRPRPSSSAASPALPELNFAFLEGGAGWACSSLADLIGHWEKRNRKVSRTRTRRGSTARSCSRWRRSTASPRCWKRCAAAKGLDDNGDGTGGVEDLDDYSRCKITRKEDFTIFTCKRFYFGCEADDPINAWAFNRKANPMQRALNAFFSSDIGHFDVPDMTEVVPEAYELVEHGCSTRTTSATSCSPTPCASGRGEPRLLQGHGGREQAAEVLARPR